MLGTLSGVNGEMNLKIQYLNVPQHDGTIKSGFGLMSFEPSDVVNQDWKKDGEKPENPSR